MSSRELLYRSKTLFGRWQEEGRWKLGVPSDNEGCFSALDEPRAVFNDVWPASSDYTSICQKLGSEHQAYINEIVEAADAICRREFTLLGVPVQYPSELSWIADPLSGKNWPMCFYTRIKIFGGDREIGDVKYVWELNRHQFLTVLGKAYRLSGDGRYASAAVELIQDWIKANPYNIGVNWTSALEVAIRSLSWCQIYELIHDSSALDPDKRQCILRSLYQHGHYIEKHLSFFFSPYNHLIGEAAALYIVGSLLSWLKPARRWKRKGWAILEQEMSKQFHADGGTVEQATGYHHFTLGFYLQAVLLRRRLGDAIPSTVWSLLERTFEFSMYMTRPDGKVPMIGDGDEGKAIDISQASVWDFRSILAIGAVLFQRGDFKKIAGPFLPDVSWLLGTEGWNSYQALREEEPKEDSKALPESGYYIMRTGWDLEAHYLNFDCGQIAAEVSKDDIPSAAHGHADALSIEVSSFGIPTIVDPGFYTYNGDEKWHRYFRETAAHNTVAVDGRSQAKYCGRLKWSHAPETRIHSWMTSVPFDYVEGSHDGYRRLSQPVRHRRAVAFLKPNYWLVRDELSGEGEHQVERFLHLAPMKVTCDQESKVTLAQCHGRGQLAILAAETEGVTVELSEGGQNPEDGWLAPGYGKKVVAPVVRYATTASLPLAVHLLLIPFREELPKIEVKTAPVEGGVLTDDRSVMIRLRETTDILVFSSGQRTVQFYNDWLTNGRIACLRLDEENRIVSLTMIDGSVVQGNGGVSLKTSKTIHYVAIYFQNGRPIIELSEDVKIWTSFPNYRVIVTTPHTKSALQTGDV